MLEIVRDNYISQVNFQPTRERNILDLLFVTSPDLVESVPTVPGMSDHEVIIANIDTKAKINKKTSRFVDLYSKANWQNLKHDLDLYQQEFFSSNPSEKSVQENWDSLKDVVSKVTKDHIPQKKISGRWNLPYMTRELKRKIRKKCRQYNKAKRSGSADDWKKFKSLRALLRKN